MISDNTNDVQLISMKRRKKESWRLRRRPIEQSLNTISDNIRPTVLTPSYRSSINNLASKVFEMKFMIRGKSLRGF